MANGRCPPFAEAFCKNQSLLTRLADLFLAACIWVLSLFQQASFQLLANELDTPLPFRLGSSPSSFWLSFIFYGHSTWQCWLWHVSHPPPSLSFNWRVHEIVTYRRRFFISLLLFPLPNARLPIVSIFLPQPLEYTDGTTLYFFVQLFSIAYCLVTLSADPWYWLSSKIDRWCF